MASVIAMESSSSVGSGVGAFFDAGRAGFWP